MTSTSHGDKVDRHGCRYEGWQWPRGGPLPASTSHAAPVTRVPSVLLTLLRNVFILLGNYAYNILFQSNSVKHVVFKSKGEGIVRFSLSFSLGPGAALDPGLAVWRLSSSTWTDAWKNMTQQQNKSHVGVEVRQLPAPNDASVIPLV